MVGRTDRAQLNVPVSDLIGKRNRYERNKNGRKDIKVFYTNVRRLNNKMEELEPTTGL